MIQLESITIEEFRGIRSMEMELGSRSFVIHGPNGSGKSGIVDAIDFALTGSIRRLTGAGTGGVTVSAHGPHVHQRNNPGAATVTLTIRHVESGKLAKITRSVKTAGEFTLEPDDPELRDAVLSIGSHPELTLSRREILKFVVAQPSSRAQEVQALLKLDRLSDFRKLLKSTLTNVSRAASTAQSAKESAEEALRSHLDVAALGQAAIAEAVNQRRATLGASPLSSVSIDASFAGGIADVAAVSDINLPTARREVDALKARVGQEVVLVEAHSKVELALGELSSDESLRRTLQHHGLYESGLALVDDDNCPLCGTAWPSADALRAHVQEQIERSTRAKDLSDQITAASNEYRARVDALRRELAPVARYAERASLSELRLQIDAWSEELGKLHERLRTLDSLLANSDDLGVPQPVSELADGLEVLRLSLAAEPNQSEAVEALTFLTTADDRRNTVRIARAKHGDAQVARSAAEAIYDSYCAAMDGALTRLYEQVEEDLVRFYRLINADDEGGFSAELAPKEGSLDFQVDFYGQGKFPPTAYHSEGHQDGMGVCIYLALVRQLLGDEFRFAILDDVVTSVDVNHRRQFCRLLANEFPDVQFIITTHDPVWARQMRAEGLVSSRSEARLHGWTVDAGPFYENGETWDRIEEDLGRDDVNAAASKLRRHLEAAAGDIAEEIGGRVAYRSAGNYELGDLLSAIVGRHGDLLGRAAQAANSWNDAAAASAVAEEQARRKEAGAELDREKWAINPLVHNTDWAQMSVADFGPVVEAARAFLDLFTCSNVECGGWIHTSGWPEPEVLRCRCGSYSLNLLKK